MVPSRMNSAAPKAGRGKVAVLCGLAMILAALGFRLLKPKLAAGHAAAPPPLPAAAASTPGAQAAAVAPPAKPNVIRWPDAAARNPFHSAAVYPPQAAAVEPAKVAPAVAPPPVDLVALARESIRLKGTVQGERSFAMVNGRLCRIGESVAGFRIVEIGKRSIVVEQAGSRVMIEHD